MTAAPRFRLVDVSSAPVVDLVAPRRGPDAVAVLVRPDARPSVSARRTATLLGVGLERRLERASAKGRPGEVVDLQVDVPEGDPGAQVESFLVAGVGSADVPSYRRAGAALARRTRDRKHVVVDLVVRRPALLRAFVEGWGLAAYSFDRRSERAARPTTKVELVVPTLSDELDDALARAVVTVEAVRLARDLASTPSNEKSPAWFAARAERAVRDRGSRVKVRVRDENQLAAQGFNGILAVGAGSTRPPRLIEMRYVPRGADASSPHVVLVGKGITFDTGGLSLKPAEGMTAMKTDMAGGAAVVAAMSALAALDIQVKVTGLVAAAENMPSGTAQRPGDVIEHYGGTTVEVLNTDAEGRLVLADALAYADARLDPDALVDVATLTGAATLGLGRRHAAMFANDDRLARTLERAADESGERVWRMPLVDDYRPALASDVADLAHISQDRHVHGGAITAALFLEAFVGERPWVHLDIAGTGRADADEHETTKGPTGWGTRTLLRWLETL